MMTLANITGLPDGTTVTTSRAVFEVGVPDLEGRLHFATYGDQAFETVLAHVGAFDLPSCVRRLEVVIPEGSIWVVGYAVAHTGDDGTVTCRLVTAMRDLHRLRLNDEAQLTEADVGSLAQALAAMARAEHQHTLAVPRIEAINQAAGRSQECLAYLVIRAIIQARQRTGGAEPLLWPEIEALEDIFQVKDQIRIRRLPSDQVRHLSGLLFTLTIPATGDASYLDAPYPLLMASLDAAYRVAKGMKVKRVELSTADFLARLNREIVRVAQENVRAGFKEEHLRHGAQ